MWRFISASTHQFYSCLFFLPLLLLLLSRLLSFALFHSFHSMAALFLQFICWFVFVLVSSTHFFLPSHFSRIEVISLFLSLCYLVHACKSLRVRSVCWFVCTTIETEQKRASSHWQWAHLFWFVYYVITGHKSHNDMEALIAQCTNFTVSNNKTNGKENTWIFRLLLSLLFTLHNICLLVLMFNAASYSRVKYGELPWWMQHLITTDQTRSEATAKIVHIDHNANVLEWKMHSIWLVQIRDHYIFSPREHCINSSVKMSSNRKLSWNVSLFSVRLDDNCQMAAIMDHKLCFTIEAHSNSII